VVMIPGHERLAGVPAAPPGSADVDPTRPRRRRQGRRATGAAARGGGAAPAGAPPEAATGRPAGAGGIVPTAAPPALVGVLRYPGYAVALAPGAARPTLDLSAQQNGPTAGRPRSAGAR